MNRGQAKRPVFLTSVEIRYFLSRLAREVRRGEVEVHGYCILTTHFHLLVRSSKGQLSEAMRRIENPFVRWFNRRHGRDGALFRGRFTSRRIRGERYLENVKRYIDNNSVAARLVTRPGDYPHGSAHLHNAGTSPIWLHRQQEEPSANEEKRDEPINGHARWVIERRLERHSQETSLDDLIGSAPEKIRLWMEHKARVADGPRTPHCLVSPDALRSAIESARLRIGPWAVAPRARKKDGWLVLELGLSREFVGLSTLESALRIGVARSSAGHAILEHRHLMLADSVYADLAAEVLSRSLALTFGER